MRVIQSFLTASELFTLRRLSNTCVHYEGARPGIYKCGTVHRFGTGYGIPDALYQKFLTAAGLTPPFEGRSIQQFISYKEGGFIQPHKDWVYDVTFTHQLHDLATESREACKLHRVNVMVDSAAKGGELFVDGEEVKLNEGDALVLRPELQEHEVKTIVEGSRMIFTIGFHHKATLPRMLA